VGGVQVVGVVGVARVHDCEVRGVGAVADVGSAAEGRAEGCIGDVGFIGGNCGRVAWGCVARRCVA
jgi:hypothetical protein